MGLAADILRAWRHPRRAMRRQLANGHREDRALAYLALACFLIFVAQWPRLSRDAALDPSVPFDARIGGALLAWLFLAPLGLYAIAAASRVAARVLGGSGSWFSARLALFWSLLVVAPLWLLNGIIVGAGGAGMVASLAGSIALAAFVAVWLLSLYEAEKGGHA